MGDSGDQAAGRQVVVVTGASAGVGRAVAEEFARHGARVAVLARNRQRLDAVCKRLHELGGEGLPLVVDVADADAVDAAAQAVEEAFGPIDVWVNSAMVTVYAPVHCTSAQEYRRTTEVTYLGTVHGTLAALRRMRPRNRGAIVQVGSALSYRAIPLQSAYCAAKFAIRGFTDALRVELLHERSAIGLCMVQLSAFNTPQFDWARNKTGERAQPVPPIFQPELAARAVRFAACSGRREVLVGFPAVKAVWGNKLAPWLADRILARQGYDGQTTGEPLPEPHPDNLFDTVEGAFGAHGRFDQRARSGSLQLLVTMHRGLFAVATLAVLGGTAALLWWVAVV